MTERKRAALAQDLADLKAKVEKLDPELARRVQRLEKLAEERIPFTDALARKVRNVEMTLKRMSQGDAKRDERVSRIETQVEEVMAGLDSFKNDIGKSFTTLIGKMDKVAARVDKVAAKMGVQP